MSARDTTVLGHEILQPEDLDLLRRYFRETRAGLERIYADAGEEEKRRHFRILSKKLVARGVRQIERQLDDDDRSLLETMLPDIERIVLGVFEDEFGLASRQPE